MLKLLLPLSLALVVGHAANPALAQSGQSKADVQKVEDIKKQDPVPPATGTNLPEQAGTTEPSSKAPGTSKQEDAFANGLLTAPGASTEVDTQPAKFSARTDAHDRIPIAGYRLFKITDEQRREIAQQLALAGKSAAAGINTSYAVVGAEIPATLAQRALQPMPDALAAKYPELGGTAFMLAGDKLLVVDVDNSRVVGVLDG